MSEGGDTGKYAKLVRHKRRHSDLRENSAFSNILPPKDEYNAIYIAFIVGGAGFLFPYNR